MMTNASQLMIFMFMVLVNMNVIMPAMGFIAKSATIAETKNRHHRSIALLVDNNKVDQGSNNDNTEIDSKEATTRTQKSFAKTATPTPKAKPTKTSPNYAHSKNPSSTSTASPFVMMQMSPAGTTSPFVAHLDDEEVVTYSYPTIVASFALSILLGFSIGYGT